jgi:hypothetical protein
MNQQVTKLDSAGRGKEWGVILAGGDGTRLKSLTRKIAGDERPKQFCSVLCKETLLEETRTRAALELPRDRTLYVVNRAHEPYYKPILLDEPARNLVVQPSNRGTAPAILYSLLRIAAIDPQALVAFSLRITIFPTTKSLWPISVPRWTPRAAETIWLYCLDWIRKVRKWNMVGSNRRRPSWINRGSMAFAAFGRNPINFWLRCCNFAAACGTVL